jgi:hypothetical protein
LRHRGSLAFGSFSGGEVGWEIKKMEVAKLFCSRVGAMAVGVLIISSNQRAPLDMVPDERTALRIAEVVITSRINEAFLQRFKPLVAERIGAKWLITGKAAGAGPGEIFEPYSIIIDAGSGRIEGANVFVNQPLLRRELALIPGDQQGGLLSGGDVWAIDLVWRVHAKVLGRSASLKSFEASVRKEGSVQVVTLYDKRKRASITSWKATTYRVSESGKVSRTQ